MSQPRFLLSLRITNDGSKSVSRRLKTTVNRPLEEVARDLAEETNEQFWLSYLQGMDIDTRLENYLEHYLVWASGGDMPQ